MSSVIETWLGASRGTVARLEDDGKLDNGSLNGVHISLEVAAVLSEKSEIEDRDMAASVGLRALYLGRYADMGKTSARRVVHNRLTPVILQGKHLVVVGGGGVLDTQRGSKALFFMSHTRDSQVVSCFYDQGSQYQWPEHW